MTPTEYIQSKLKEIFSKFSEAKIRYEHRVNTQSHLIEIIPLSFFETDEAYLIEEALFEEEFEQLFPNENIVFISENSLTQIDNSEFELGYNHFVFNSSEPSEFKIEISGLVDAIISTNEFNFALAA